MIYCCPIPDYLNSREGGGHLAVYYTSPQSSIITFSYSLALQLWGLLFNFDWLIQCGNFVYYYLAMYINLSAIVLSL